jgi:hypothetical protein
MSTNSPTMASSYHYDLTCILLDITSTKEMMQFSGVTYRSEVTSAKKRQHESWQLLSHVETWYQLLIYFIYWKNGTIIKICLSKLIKNIQYILTTTHFISYSSPKTMLGMESLWNRMKEMYTLCRDHVYLSMTYCQRLRCSSDFHEIWYRSHLWKSAHLQSHCPEGHKWISTCTFDIS